MVLIIYGATAILTKYLLNYFTSYDVSWLLNRNSRGEIGLGQVKQDFSSFFPKFCPKWRFFKMERIPNLLRNFEKSSNMAK